ncbi:MULTISPECIES: hypothetical protein [Stutzerimonas stutzeri subgroup]|uniref:hypothetical protein n=1 Tax=Stutzerimonas stutzeri subgroup TaxID=578833 RepID=UPI0028AAD373|nr:hypothetical protein [Stutzerimonas kunmingensis]
MDKLVEIGGCEAGAVKRPLAGERQCMGTASYGETGNRSLRMKPPGGSENSSKGDDRQAGGKKSELSRTHINHVRINT